MVSKRTTTKRRNSNAGRKAPAKRRRTTKQMTFHDDEGDTITFRLSTCDGEHILSELVNGKTTLKKVTMIQINESTGKVVDDDGEKDCFTLNEVEKLPELRDLAEEAGLTVDWIPKQPKSILKNASKDEPTEPVAEEITEPVKPSLPQSFSTEVEEPEKPVKEVKEAKKATPTKPKVKRTRRSRSKSRTPRRKRKPKVWEPIVFEDTEGDKVSFTITPEGFLQEKVNGKVTLAKVSRLSLNTAVGRIEDDDGKADAFTVKETEQLGKLRDMACHAMDLNLYWSTEPPKVEAWCTVM